MSLSIILNAYKISANQVKCQIYLTNYGRKVDLIFRLDINFTGVD